MNIRLVDGPFAAWRSWQFKVLAEQACKIEFRLHYEFSSKVFEKVIGPVFSHIANTFVDAFVRRAAQVYGETMAEMLQIQVCYARPDKQELVDLKLPEGPPATGPRAMQVAAEHPESTSRRTSPAFRQTSKSSTPSCATRTGSKSIGPPTADPGRGAQAGPPKARYEKGRRRCRRPGVKPAGPGAGVGGHAPGAPDFGLALIVFQETAFAAGVGHGDALT